MKRIILLIFTLVLDVQPQSLPDERFLTASPATVLVLNTTQLKLNTQDMNDRPDITVMHNHELALFLVSCHIPGSDEGGYRCFLTLGDEHRPLKRKNSHQQFGKTLCIFSVLENEFSNNLRSVQSKVMSCSYSPKTAPSKRIYSDQYNLTAFFPVQIQPPPQPPTTKETLYLTPTFSSSATTTESNTTPASETSTLYETTINPTTATPASETSTLYETTINPTTATPAPETSTLYETTINPTTATQASETSTLYDTTINSTEMTPASHPLIVTVNTTVASAHGETADHKTHKTSLKTMLIMTLTATGGGVFLTGLTIVALCCIRGKPRKKSSMKTSVNIIYQTADVTDDNEDKLYHIYCSIPDVSAGSQPLYSLAHPVDI